MEPATEPQRRSTNHLGRFIHSTAANFSRLLIPKPKPKTTSSPAPIISTISGSPPKVFLPLPFADSPVGSTQNDSPSSGSKQPSAIRSRRADPSSDFPSMMRIGGLKSAEGGGGSGGPAFVGQVFSMCDITGTGLMAVSTDFDIPFISKRAPEWIKKMFSIVTKNESGPVFRFFLDLGDAVSYVKQLNIPSGVVGACRLDLAYEHFKEKPHLFQFVPNSRQVKEASRLLRGNKRKSARKIDGVPVFSAQNLDIAIATPEGIKWYTPYFFDKSILDNILEESVDQHFHALIQSRHVQRQRDVIDDNVAAEITEDSADSIWEPIEELMDEMGQSGIPLSVISKAAEMQLQYAVDKVLLGNRWLRRATGIQPRFPYMVDSFERRTALSWSRASKSAISSAKLDVETHNELPENSGSAKLEPDNRDSNALLRQDDLCFPSGGWLRLPWSKPHQEPKSEADTRMVDSSGEYMKEQLQTSPLLPRITMVGIATTEPAQMSKATIKKTMEDLSKELEQEGPEGSAGKSSSDKCYHEDRDPLFVANVGDYYSNMGKTSSPRWVRGMQS